MTEVTDLEKPNLTNEDERLQAQRKMKMKEIKDSMMGDRPECFSPPRLTHVNEWKQSFGKAEKAQSERIKDGDKANDSFYPDVEYKHGKNTKNGNTVSSTEDTSRTLHTNTNIDKKNELNRQNSFTTKIFRNGIYNEIEDLGYSSSSTNNDLLSHSLPSGIFNSSISSTKVVYDQRIYNDPVSAEKENVEEQYFQSFKNFHNSTTDEQVSNSSVVKPKNAFSNKINSSNDAFMSFLSRSLSKKFGKTPTENGTPTPIKVTPMSSKPSSANSSNINESSDKKCGKVNTGELEMKDSQTNVEEQWSNKPNEYNNYLSRSVTASEFGDPDPRGRTKSKTSPSKSFFKTISHVFSFIVNDKKSSMDVEDPDRNCLCKRSEHHLWSRKMSWGMFFFLLLIDIITIILMMIVFEKFNELKSIERISLASIAQRQSMPAESLVSSITQEASIIPTSPPSKGTTVLTRMHFDPDRIYFPDDIGDKPELTNGKRKGDGDIKSSTSNEDELTSRNERNIVISRTFNVFENKAETTIASSSNISPQSTKSALTPTLSSTESTSPTTISDINVEIQGEKMKKVQIMDRKKAIQQAKDEIFEEMDYIISNLSREIQDLKNQIEVLKRPPIFSCYRTSEHNTEGVIKYTDCNVKTPGMNPNTGKFTVQIPGVYKISFTGLFKAVNGHAVNADIIKKTFGGRFEFLGRSSADTNEIGTIFGANDDTILTTSTLTIMTPLNLEDEVYVTMSIETNHGYSSIYSSANPAIHFIGEWVSSN
ncbi:uncharacterized protein [Lepeophtheirus salmonis]|uniref:uncharacterized protein isoform X2 n=1 Tax=Lepeophtheirus salmonis TaxID=72036 RepID=UPI001AE8C81C|nr:uncharacterized protein LOC121120619 isoform X2 [Lepeophtheirus salmonis]